MLFYKHLSKFNFRLTVFYCLCLCSYCSSAHSEPEYALKCYAYKRKTMYVAYTTVKLFIQS